jgi:hypothetical protein
MSKMGDVRIEEMVFNEKEKQALDKYFVGLVSKDPYREFLTAKPSVSKVNLRSRDISRPEFNRSERSWYDRE